MTHEGLRPYDLRHDFLCRAGLAGVPAVVLRDVAGHRSSAMTDHYTKLRPGYLDAAFEAAEYKGLKDGGDELVTTAGKAAGRQEMEAVEVAEITVCDQAACEPDRQTKKPLGFEESSRVTEERDSISVKELQRNSLCDAGHTRGVGAHPSRLLLS